MLSERKVYHVTKASALAEINRLGLLPRIGPRSAKLGELVPGIYVFLNIHTLEEAILNWLEDEFDDVELVVLEVRVKDKWLEKTEAAYEAKITKVITPERIKLYAKL